MNDEILRAVLDLTYARANFFRQNSRYHTANMSQFLSNEAWLIGLLNRFPVERNTQRRPQVQIRTRLAFNDLDSLFPDNFSWTDFLEHVTIRLTPEQLEQATHDWMPPADSTEVCCICQDNLGTMSCIETTCRHHLHRQCSNEWFAMSNKCPVCRADLREAQPTNTNGTTTGSSLHTDIQS